MNVVTKFKDGSYTNVPADHLIVIPNTNLVQAWTNDDKLVGVINTEEVVAVYLSCKKGAENG